MIVSSLIDERSAMNRVVPLNGHKGIPYRQLGGVSFSSGFAPTEQQAGRRHLRFRDSVLLCDQSRLLPLDPGG